jgi:phosphate transport system permease protein
MSFGGIFRESPSVMPETIPIRRLDQRPLREALLTRGRSIVPGFSREKLIKYFFGANAWIAIVVLGLIMLSLYQQSVGFDPARGFFGQDYRSQLVYREAGLEFVDIIKQESADLDDIGTYLAGVRLDELKKLLAQGKSLDDANAALGPFDTYVGNLTGLDGGLSDIASPLGDTAVATKEQLKEVQDKMAEKELYLRSGKADLAAKVSWQSVDLDAAVKPLRDALPALRQANDKFRADLIVMLPQPIPAVDDAMKTRLVSVPSRIQTLINAVPGYQHKLDTWSPKTPVPWYAGVADFFGNSRWLTASSWQDYYGIMPLLVGSLLISGVALFIAVPLGVGAGIYINQIATPWEQAIIKPAIEFISAIPSVVLGFFGVAILGQSLRGYSHDGLLYFLPASFAGALPGWLHSILAFSIFPPFSERLNILTAGILLAFMAVPTIFTLTEDAINNVPRAFKEASFALGATRLQTIWRIILPASLSGVISAVLLGFGRVIGETMVVLLCAGNRIAIPPLSQGLAVVFQPVHTMTGIIAQELGEVETNGIHWHALFTVGLLLFLISLVVNFLAQRLVQRFKISIG